MIYGTLHKGFSIQVGRLTLHTPFSVSEIRVASQESSPHKVGTPCDSLTIPAELEVTLCHFSYPPASVDPVQSCLAHFGADYLKKEEPCCIIYFSSSSQELRSYASSMILVLYLDISTEEIDILWCRAGQKANSNTTVFIMTLGNFGVACFLIMISLY